MNILNRIHYRFWADDIIRRSNEYMVSYSFVLKGELNINYLVKALHDVMSDYYPFHSIIRQIDNKPYYIPLTSFEVPLEIIKSKDEKNENIIRKIDELSKKRFILEKELPCNFYLWEMSDKFIFLSQFHHIVIDGLTFVDFCNRLSLYYNNYYSHTSILPSFVQLDKFNTYWNNNENEEKIKKSTDYWINYLSNSSLHTSVPRQNNVQNDSSDKTHFFILGEDVFTNAKKFTTEQSSTLFRLFSSVWICVINKFLQTDDVLLDHTVHLRPKEFAGLMGTFVNNLPIRVDMNGMKSFNDILLYMKENRHAERQHQNVFYTDIISEMRHKGMLKDSLDIFNIGIDYPIKNHDFKFDFIGCQSEFLWQSQAAMIGDICLVIEENAQLYCSIRYKHDIPSEFIAQMAEAFELVLNQVLAKPDIQISDLKYINDSRRKEILSLSTASLHNIDINSITDIISLIKNQSISNPDAIAIKYKEKSLSYRQLEHESDCFANYLSQKIIPGDNVGVLMRRSDRMIIAILGILKSGCAYVPLNINNPEQRNKHIVDDCNIGLIIVDNDNSSIYGKQTSTVVTGGISEKSPKTINISKKAYILYTSGTTGEPKGIVISHLNLAVMVQNEIRLFCLNQHSSVLQYANIFFDASVTEIFSTLAAGATMVIADEIDQHDPLKIASLIDEYSITCATIPPAMLPVLPKRDFSSLQTIIVGGESTDADSIDYWKTKKRFINGYGPTENTVDTSVCIMTADTPHNDIGKPLNGTVCYVLDKDLNILPYYVPGELYIGGLQLSSGYIGKPLLNAQYFITNPYHESTDVAPVLYRTGDIVQMTPNGHLLFLGRRDNQVKLRGQRIELSEIEKAISQNKDVTQAIVRVDNTHGNKHIVAYVESAVLSDALSLYKFLKGLLPSYMVPTYWSIVNRFPLTDNGKIDEKKLPAATPLSNIKKEMQREHTSDESILCNIISNVTSIENIHADDDLIELGISSLQIIKIVFEAEKRGIDISVYSVYEGRCVTNILKDKRSRLYYWGNQYSSQKPILLLICGYPYYRPQFDFFTETLGKTYSILIFESFQEYYKGRNNCTADELLESYMDVIQSILKDKKIDSIFGYCLGGDLGLQLAVRLSNKGIAKPKVYVLDGIAKRGELDILGYLIEPGIDKELNKQRNKVSDEIERSFKFHKYDGDIHICLAKHFVGGHIVNSNDDCSIDKDLNEKLYQRFLDNPKEWKEVEPQCQIHYINASHMELLLPESIIQVADIITST